MKRLSTTLTGDARSHWSKRASVFAAFGLPIGRLPCSLPRLLPRRPLLPRSPRSLRARMAGLPRPTGLGGGSGEEENEDADKGENGEGEEEGEEEEEEEEDEAEDTVTRPAPLPPPRLLPSSRCFPDRVDRTGRNTLATAAAATTVESDWRGWLDGFDWFGRASWKDRPGSGGGCTGEVGGWCRSGSDDDRGGREEKAERGAASSAAVRGQEDAAASSESASEPASVDAIEDDAIEEDRVGGEGGPGVAGEARALEVPAGRDRIMSE